jgi:hypothetical protein
LRLVAALCLLLAAVIELGCGGVRAADLFVVTRTGAGPHARLTLLVNEEGGVNCNGGPTLKLDDSQLIKADAIKEELEKPASSGLSLAPRLGSVLSYSVRSEHGTVRFSDNSTHQPKVLRELALLVLQTAQQVCHLPE